MTSAPDETLDRRFARDVAARLQSKGYTALWAGGCVRDELRGVTPKDYDVATDATPGTVREVFGRGRTLAVGESFGVIIVRPPKPKRNGHGSEPVPEPVEVATFRKEGPYLDGRRPSRVVFCTPEEDAHRRDFTINGLFYDPIADEVFDYVGGREDLEVGRVRAIGDPAARMTEDKLRLLRAVRFTATFAFQLEPATFSAVRAMADQITVVSAERIAAETRRMLAHPNRTLAVELLEQTGLLAEILPERMPIVGTADWTTIRNALSHLPPDHAEFVPAMAMLLRGLADETETLSRRLTLSNDERERIGWLVKIQPEFKRFAEQPIAARKRLMAKPGFGELLAIGRAFAAAGGFPREPLDAATEHLAEWSAEEIDPPPLIGGADLIAAGLKPGPEFKTILDTVRDAQLEHRVINAEEAMGLARSLREGSG